MTHNQELLNANRKLSEQCYNNKEESEQVSKGLVTQVVNRIKMLSIYNGNELQQMVSDINHAKFSSNDMSQLDSTLYHINMSDI